MTGFPRDSFPRQINERAHLGCGRSSMVHDDVRVPLEDPRCSMHVSLETTFVDQPAGSDTFDFLEDRACARVQPQVGVALVSPLQIATYDLAELLDWLGCETKCRRQNDVCAVVQDALVVSELEVVDVHGDPLAVFGKKLGRLKDLLDEHGSIPGGCQEVQVLPERTSYRAGDAHKVVQTPQAPSHRRVDEVRIHLDPRSSSNPVPVEEVDPRHLAANDETPEPGVADQNVGSMPEEEPWYVELARRTHCALQLVSRSDPHEEVGWSTDPKGCEWGEGCVDLDGERGKRRLKA